MKRSAGVGTGILSRSVASPLDTDPNGKQAPPRALRRCDLR